MDGKRRSAAGLVAAEEEEEERGGEEGGARLGLHLSTEHPGEPAAEQQPGEEGRRGGWGEAEWEDRREEEALDNT